MNFQLLSLLFLILLVSTPLSAQVMTIDEVDIIELSLHDTPALSDITTNAATQDAKFAQNKDQFAPEVHIGLGYLNSRERRLNTFSFVVNEAQTRMIKINQKTKYGVDLYASFNSDKQTNTFLTGASKQYLELGVGIDLYQGLIKNRYRNELDANRLGRERAKFEKHVHTHTFVNEMRKIYWSLVANEEAEKITNQLLNTATAQLQQSEQKYKSRVADLGEVSRNRAQVANRKAELIRLQYQKSQLVQVLKEALPSMRGVSLQLKKYNLDTTIAEVLSCSAKIQTYSRIPIGNTKYDEITKLLRRQSALGQEVASNYDDIRVLIDGNVQAIGKDFGDGQAFEDLKNNYRNAYSVGVNLVIPLGSKKKETADLQKLINDKRHMTQVQMNENKVAAFHEETVRAVSYLQEAVRNQKLTSKNLSISVKESTKKYNQARINAQQLIQEQDNLLQSKLNEIQTNLAVVHTILDYLSVFTETPCVLNRIKL